MHGNVTHNESKSNINSKKTRLYSIWSNMIARTRLKPGQHNYEYYAGKGIEVCDEWLDYGKFKLWSNLNGYSDDLSIDRIDNTDGYNPSNCRWSTAKEQSENKTNGINKKVTRDEFYEIKAMYAMGQSVLSISKLFPISYMSTIRIVKGYKDLYFK